jgi:hypothetical protein
MVQLIYGALFGLIYLGHYTAHGFDWVELMTIIVVEILLIAWAIDECLGTLSEVCDE